MSKNNYKIFVRFVGLLFVIFALIGAADTARMNNVMAEREKFPQLEKLLTLGEEDELIRIFVGFDLQTGYKPENQINPSAVENQKRAIRETQSSILSSLADADHKVVVRGEYDFIPYIALDVDQETLLALSEMPNVISIEERHLNETSLSQSIPSINGDDMRTAGYTGEGYTVAILDTGIEANHSAFESRVVSEACFSSDDYGALSQSLCPNGLAEQTGAGSASAMTSACYDSYGDNICYHGTHVASIAAGVSPYYGVAPDANIIAVQVFFRYEHPVYGSVVYADDADIIKGLQQVYTLRGTYNITSVNMSFGSGKYASTCDSLSGAMVTAVANLKNAGIQVVAASGNEGYTDGISFPACLSNVISVGSTNDYDATPSSFSNVAGILDLFAPGDNITAAYPGDSYATLYGTSMAAPHVTGAFAVLKGKHPSISTADILTAFKSSGPMVTKSGVSRHRIDLVAADNYLLPSAFNGSAEITSDQPIVAIGRPHMGAEIMGYNGINSGATTLYLPMLFNNLWNYTSTFTVENTTSSTATYTLTFKDGGNGTTSCVMSNKTLPGHGVKTYDVTNLGACDSGYLPDLWAGGAKIESDQPLVAIATPKVDGVDPVTYNAFTGGADTVYLPMLFRNVWGYTSAFYVQNLDSTQNASISIDFYDGLGHFTCRYEDSSPIGPAVTRGYWVPSMSCNDGNSFPAEGWAGSAVIETGGSGSQEIVAIGRPHMGTEVAAYNGFTEGGTSNYLPMLFRNMWGYTSAVYIQNVSGGTITEPIEIVFYDAEGNYTCTYRDDEDLADKATRGYWIPSVNCNAGGSFPGDGWVGSATIHTSGEAIAVGRPHLSDGEVVAYGAFTGGETEAYVPMLFRKYNGNEAALYIQNLGDSDATVTITYYDEESGYYCAMAQEISPLSTGGVWLAGLDGNSCNSVP